MAYIFEYLNWTYYLDHPESVTRIHGLPYIKMFLSLAPDHRRAPKAHYA